MEEIIKLILPFFSTAKDYAQVLKRLASFAFYETYIITLVLRTNSNVDSYFKGIESWSAVGKVIEIIPHHEAINVSGILIAFIVALLTHMFQFHDRISDVLGIRHRFDHNHILVPLAKRVGAHLTKNKEATIKSQQDRLMHAVFYRYASSRNENALVDKHDIEHAVNAWSWFWVCLEAVAYFSIGAIVALAVGSNDVARIFAIVATVAMLIGIFQRIRLPSYARPQVERIATDTVAASDVKREFDAV